MMVMRKALSGPRAYVAAAVAAAIALTGLAALGHRDEPPTWQPQPHAIIVTGDVLLGREIERQILSGVDLFANVAPVLDQAQEVIINLESPLTRAKEPLDKEFVFRARPEAVSVLVDGGVTITALANNHIGDYGPEGLTDTLTYLDLAGIDYVGAGRNLSAASRPLFLEKQAPSVAVVNFSQYDSPTAPAATDTRAGQAYYGTAAFEQSITKARSNAEFVIAIVHHGIEYRDFPSQRQIDMSRRAIELGADVVIGHHPHVTQGIEEYLGKTIFYSIGNFIFDQETEPWERSFFIAIDFLDDQPVYTLYPYFIRKGVPQFMSDSDAQEFFARINDISPVPLIRTEEGLGFL
jgi:gamma-polyglutamate biosynthesis protein CapA